MGKALILSAALGSLGACDAANALAAGWAERWQVAVLPPPSQVIPGPSALAQTVSIPPETALSRAIPVFPAPAASQPVPVFPAPAASQPVPALPAQSVPELAAWLEAEPALRLADIAVVGCDCFDFATRGGPLVQAVARVCLSRQLPCLVFAREVNVSLREMRTFGVEEAHRVTGSDSTQAVTASAARVGAGWASAGPGVAAARLR